jgi:2-phospho-L-lactate transferase/gluconeogenesis factor (CofD/UPF0052 family)
MDKLKVLIFSGGRGSEGLIQYFCQDNFDLKILVNGYDDGLSTGQIRHVFQGMLGPSDYRKTVTNILRHHSDGDRYAAELLELRISIVESPATQTSFDKMIADPQISGLLKKMKYSNSVFITKYLTHGYREYIKATNGAPIENFSAGNLVFLGLYLELGDFNEAVKQLQSYLGLPDIVQNVTDGEDLKLVALCSSGKVLNSESEIVNASNEDISQIFLLKKYLEEIDLEAYSKINYDQSKDRLTKIQHSPHLSEAAGKALSQADVVIYGPGTPHSSLFPSYMTPGLVEEIRSNTKALKILITNIEADFESKNETVSSLFSKMIFYLGAEIGEKEKLVDFCLIQKQNTETIFTHGDVSDLPGAILLDWNVPGNKIHTPSHLRGVISYLISQRYPGVFKYYQGLAIVIPVKNEVRTISKAIDQLVNIDLLDIGFIYSLLFVDGGSTDGTYEKLIEISKRIGVAVMQVPNKHQIGQAILGGVATRSEEFVITFPADCEYPIDSIVAVANSLRKNPDALVIASRLVGQTEDNSRNLELVYGTSFLRQVSKFGGMLLTVVLGVRFQRWVTDPLSSVKGISLSQFNSLNVKSESFSIHTEIIRKSISKSVSIIEVPTNYFPRSYRHGKKTNFVDGLKALYMCFKRISR